MEKQVLIISLIVGGLGVLSVILGFTAEVTKINATDVYVGDFACYYPSSPAFGCAIGAALLLVIAQIIVTIFSGCCGCCKADPNVPTATGTTRTIAIILVVFSWITFGISIVLYILGADRNGPGNVTNYDTCYVVKPGIFATGAIFALLTGALSITAYILFKPSTPNKPSNPNAINGVAMGVPQFPANGGVQHPTHGTGGANYSAPGNGGVQYSAPGNGGVQHPPPGNGGVQHPPPGTGGVQYPPPGTGGTEYTSSTDMTHYPPPKGSV